MNKAFMALLFVLTSTLFAGCSTKYGCKGMPDDPTCMSAVQAYKATDQIKSPSTPAKPPVSPAAAGAAAAVPRIDDPTPIRSPSRVMRVWVAPWEDNDGDLNVSGYMFTELEPRRWMIGRSEPTLSPTIAPLQVRQPDKQALQPDTEARPPKLPGPWGSQEMPLSQKPPANP
ncbi:MAG: TraV family lipoprotein [Methylococcaceae bacterium]|nr:TraV family lipoprotein [Methylococcaceae bacterium]